jgi:hypothetical protein
MHQENYIQYNSFQIRQYRQKESVSMRAYWGGNPPKK